MDTAYFSKAIPSYLLKLWNLLQLFDFGVGEKIANARTYADSNGHNFWKIENVQGFLHIFASKSVNLTDV